MPAPESRTRKRNTTARSARKASRTTATSAAKQARSDLGLRTLQGFRMIYASARNHDVKVRRLAGISGSQLWALSEIARSGDTSVNGLAERMAVHQTTASNLLNALVERNLIRRVRDKVDERVVRLHVSTAGKRLLLRAPGPYSGLLVDALRSLDDEQLARLGKSLGVLLDGMRDKTTAAAGETLLGE